MQTGLNTRLFVLSPQHRHTRFTTWITHMYRNQDLVSYVYMNKEFDFALKA